MIKTDHIKIPIYISPMIVLRSNLMHTMKHVTELFTNKIIYEHVARAVTVRPICWPCRL